MKNEDMMEALEALFAGNQESPEEIEAREKLAEESADWLNENLYTLCEDLLGVWKGYGRDQFPVVGVQAHAVKTIMPTVNGILALLPDGSENVVRMSLALSFIGSMYVEQGGKDPSESEDEDTFPQLTNTDEVVH